MEKENNLEKENIKVIVEIIHFMKKYNYEHEKQIDFNTATLLWLKKKDRQGL
jgi:hypothetical protein